MEKKAISHAIALTKPTLRLRVLVQEVDVEEDLELLV